MNMRAIMMKYKFWEVNWYRTELGEAKRDRTKFARYMERKQSLWGLKRAFQVFDVGWEEIMLVKKIETEQHKMYSLILSCSRQLLQTDCIVVITIDFFSFITFASLLCYKKRSLSLYFFLFSFIASSLCYSNYYLYVYLSVRLNFYNCRVASILHSFGEQAIIDKKRGYQQQQDQQQKQQ